MNNSVNIEELAKQVFELDLAALYKHHPGQAIEAVAAIIQQAIDSHTETLVKENEKLKLKLEAYKAQREGFERGVMEGAEIKYQEQLSGLQVEVERAWQMFDEKSRDCQLLSDSLEASYREKEELRRAVDNLELGVKGFDEDLVQANLKIEILTEALVEIRDTLPEEDPPYCDDSVCFSIAKEWYYRTRESAGDYYCEIARQAIEKGSK
jgi:chromosome segregation ATPase